MPTKYKKDLIFRKRRLKNIDKYNTQFKVGNNYLVVTDDYEQNEIEIPIANLTKQIPVDFENDINETVQNTPLWDWFTIANLKTNKIWYCDFSMPYYQKEVNHDKNLISKAWANLEIPLKIKHKPLPNKMFEMEFIQDEDLVKQKIDFYLSNNNWEKTFDEFNKENENKLKWNEKNPLVYSNMKYDIGIVIPHSFKEFSIAECFEKSIKLFFNSKQGNAQKAYNLISETEYKKFLK